MSLTPSSMIELGTVIPKFDLPDSVSGLNVNLDSFYPCKALVVVFICNHCPYVIHIQEELAKIAKEYSAEEIRFVAISSNDIENYPADSPEKMKTFALSNEFCFPYLYDEDQYVAKSFKAECTPDFSIWDENKFCVYRGRLDDSTPGNGKPVTGEDIRMALESILEKKEVNKIQHPSMGCNIKWK